MLGGLRGRRRRIFPWPPLGAGGGGLINLCLQPAKPGCPPYQPQPRREGVGDTRPWARLSKVSVAVPRTPRDDIPREGSAGTRTHSTAGKGLLPPTPHRRLRPHVATNTCNLGMLHTPLTNMPGQRGRGHACRPSKAPSGLVRGLASSPRVAPLPSAAGSETRGVHGAKRQF